MDGNQIFRDNLFAFIIMSVKFQVKLMSAKFFLSVISCNELYITLSTLWAHWGFPTQSMASCTIFFGFDVDAE